MSSKKTLAFFLATSGHSGVDRVMENLIAELAARSYSIDLLGIKGHGPRLREPPANVSVHRFGVSHVYSSLPGLIRYLRSARPQVLLTDKDRVNRIALLAKRFSGTTTKVVVRIGTTVSKNLEKRGRLTRWMQYASIRRFYPAAYRIVLPSRGAAEDIRRIGEFGQELVHVVPNPIYGSHMLKLAQSKPEHPWFGSRSYPLILGVGELSARKNFSMLIQAFALVRRSVPASLVILGEGSQREMLQDLARRLGVADCVDLPGFVDNPYPYMARADALALSSRWEGLSCVLVEALALGTPVVAADCPSGPREILQDGKYGSLIPVDDHEAMAERLVRILADPPPREFLQQAAQPFEVGRAADAYLEAMGIGNVDARERTPHPSGCRPH